MVSLLYEIKMHVFGFSFSFIHHGLTLSQTIKEKAFGLTLNSIASTCEPIIFKTELASTC